MNTDIQFWWSVGLSVSNGALALAFWLRKPGEDAGRAVAGLRDMISAEIAELKNVQTQLEERIKHMPRQMEVSDLSGDMKAVKAQMQGLVNTQAAQTMALSRIETWLHEMTRK